MTFTRGNAAIRNHQADGKTLYLFKKASQGHVEFVGKMAYRGHHIQEGKDAAGNTREIIVFELRPLD